jgi:uncharacterized damage-inducible protein DinB
MTDRKPPKLVDDERVTLHALLQYQRDSVVRKVDGVSDEAARRELVGSGTTLLWLVKHLAQAELLWLAHRFAGEAVRVVPDATVVAGDTLAEAIDTYRATWSRVDAIARAADLNDRCHDTGDESQANLRWVLMHLLEETARHAGHADILRELIDGDTGR